MINILSLDGGGIRGLIPATILAGIESFTGRKIINYFQMLAGTSTGAIIAAALSAEIPAQEIVNFYLEKASQIFYRRWTDDFLDHFGLLDSKYKATGIETALNDVFGDKKFSDIKVQLLIPTLDISTSLPHFFTTIKSPNIKLSYATRCSSAAPTYFPPKDSYVDGGMIANDPTLCAIAEAYKIWPNQDIKVLSLGTSNIPKKIVIKNGGAIDWLKVLTDTFINGAMGLSEYEALYLLGNKYLRIQEELPETINSEMDNIDLNNMKALVRFGNELWTKNKEEILKFIS
jgi:patatin-like phospholipase/acyl hydrolase